VGEGDFEAPEPGEGEEHEGEVEEKVGDLDAQEVGEDVDAGVRAHGVPVGGDRVAGQDGGEDLCGLVSLFRWILEVLWGKGDKRWLFPMILR